MLHATIFVPCAQWIVASCFLLRSSPALLLLSDMHTDEYVMQETTCRSMLHASSNLVHTDVRPRCRADDRPRYKNTAATPAALPSASTRQPSLLRLCPPSCRTLARDHAVKSGNAFGCTARTVHRRSMPAVYLLLYRAVPRAQVFARHGKRARPTIRVVINAHTHHYSPMGHQVG